MKVCYKCKQYTQFVMTRESGHESRNTFGTFPFAALERKQQLNQHAAGRKREQGHIINRSVKIHSGKFEGSKVHLKVKTRA